MRNILLIPLKIIATIIFIPFHLIASAASRFWLRKQAAIRIRIVFGSRLAFITGESDFAEQEPEHLIAAYLLFLSQYFYSCDKRQVKPVGECMAEHIAISGQSNHLAMILLQKVRETLNAKEKDAVEGLFFKLPNRPPVTYIESDPMGPERAKYSVVTYKKGDGWLADVRVSWWATLVMFPIAVGVLYNYVADKLSDSDKSLLDSCITKLLAAQESSDFRSTREGAGYLIANKIIAENLGL